MQASIGRAELGRMPAITLMLLRREVIRNKCRLAYAPDLHGHPYVRRRLPGSASNDLGDEIKKMA
jgi:hypothetical protein